MNSYTTQIQGQLDAIFWEDEDFVDELLRVAGGFRPFSEAVEAFIREQGFTGDGADVGAKVAFIRAAFERARMNPPRELAKWFTDDQVVTRETAFQLCFAFGLDGNGTDDFFRRFYTRERSFDCHRIQEAVYYFCMNNGLSYQDAMEIQSCVPLADGRQTDGGEAVFTGSIIADLGALESKEALIDYLNANLAKFTRSNVTAYDTISRLWQQITEPGGLLMREREALRSMLDDDAMGARSKVRTSAQGVRTWDAYLAIFQLDKADVSRLEGGRSIRPILTKLHADARDSFPDRQGIDQILKGKVVSYERVRKWLILLTFYSFWVRKALREGNYESRPEDANRCLAGMNQCLMEAGYPELYVGNPYDWLFLYAAKSDEPLPLFRYIWNELLTEELEEMEKRRQIQNASGQGYDVCDKEE